MNKAVYYKIMFIINGVGNILIGLIAAILTPILPSFQTFLGIPAPSSFMWMYGFLMLAMILGFKYILVGLDITRNHLTVSTGMISKVGFFILALVFFLLGDCGWPLLAIGVVELVFVALYIEFYVNYRKLESSQISAAYAPLKRE